MRRARRQRVAKSRALARHRPGLWPTARRSPMIRRRLQGTTACCWCATAPTGHPCGGLPRLLPCPSRAAGCSAPGAPQSPTPRPAAGGAAGGAVWAQHQRRRWVLPATARPQIVACTTDVALLPAVLLVQPCPWPCVHARQGTSAGCCRDRHLAAGRTGCGCAGAAVLACGASRCQAANRDRGPPPAACRPHQLCWPAVQRAAGEQGE